MPKKSDFHKFEWDTREKFSSRFIYFIHKRLKNFILNNLLKFKKGENELVKSRCELDCEELRRQWDAIDKAYSKFVKEINIPENSRSHQGFLLMKEIYFTVLNNDANWMKFSAYVFDEYAKVRKWKKEKK